MADVSIDMDATIKGLLQTYADYVVKILDHDGPRIIMKKYRTPEEKQRETEGYYQARESYSFLKLVAENPTKYLYYPYDIVYNGFDKNGNPGVRGGTPSLHEKLDAVETLVFARSGRWVLYELSKNLSNHILTSDYKPGDKWIYYGDGDYMADNILKLNKRVHMLGRSDFVRPFMDLRPAYKFAVSQYSK